MKNNCPAWLPPSCSKQCLQPTECDNFCFKHCATKHYPNSHLLRCSNPKHPFISQPPPPKPKKLWYTNNPDISTLSKSKLKSCIEKDLELIAELKETVESAYLPNSDDTETWDPDSTSELLEAIEKIKTILETENGLQDKLEQWNYYQEGNSEDDYG